MPGDLGPRPGPRREDFRGPRLDQSKVHQQLILNITLLPTIFCGIFIILFSEWFAYQALTGLAVGFAFPLLRALLTRDFSAASENTRLTNCLRGK